MSKDTYSHERVLEACGDLSFDSGISIRGELEPLAGDGAPVKPATYSGGEFQVDRRWVGEGDGRHSVEAIVVDNVPSQSNRLEAALFDFRSELGLPEISLALDYEGRPAHVAPVLSSFQFPHRHADSYLRESQIDGKPFVDTEDGRALVMATAQEPDAILKWFPQSLLFGFWHSYTGKNTQARLARSWVSEIVGFEPAIEGTSRSGVEFVKKKGLKGDPLNLTTAFKIKKVDEQGVNTFVVGDESKDASAEKLSSIGFGQIPFSTEKQALSAVSFKSIAQQATCSFASLRRVRCDTPEKSAAARAVLVALGVVAHVHAFDRSFSLRSECELRSKNVTWTWIGENDETIMEVPDREVAVEVFAKCVRHAAGLGLPVGADVWRSVTVTPKANLLRVIENAVPVEE